MVSLISGQGYFIFLYGHTKHNINKREGRIKENKQTRIWVSSKHKKREVCDTFPAFCDLSRECIRAKLPQSHPECWLVLSRWPTRHLSPQVLALALFCRLPSSVHWSFSVLVSSALGTFIPSPSSGPMGYLACKPFVWVSHQNRQRSLLTGTYPHSYPHNECPHRVTQILLCNRKNIII